MGSYFEHYEPIDESGIVTWTPYIHPEQVVEAYHHGVFPWPESEQSIFWFSPPERGVLKFEDFALSRSTHKAFRKYNFELKINHDFRAFIELCAEVKKKTERDTWITKDLIDTYVELQKQGWVHSFETHLDGQLVGGVYGVKVNHYFSAESMFYTVSEASKFALSQMVSVLSQEGMSWIDTQMVTPFTKQLGARYISRNRFLSLLGKGTLK